MTKEEFKKSIYEAMKNKPDNWRKGQFVFNYIDSEYNGISRVLQFDYGIDCFFTNNDKEIEYFIDKSYDLINNLDMDNEK